MPRPVFEAIQRHIDLEATLGGYEAAAKMDTEIADVYSVAPSRHNAERVMPMAPANAIRREIGPIETEHFPRAERLRRRQERGVRQVHRVVSILFHEFEDAAQILRIQEPHEKSASDDELTSLIRPPTRWLEHMKGLGQNRHGGLERFPNRFQGAHTPRVLRVLRIEERDERPDIDQDHR